MKPIAIFRHYPTEGPGYFATYLDARRIPWRLIRIDAGDPVPNDPNDFAGLAFMGGPMSVNDDLPWIPPVEALIREAVAADVPVLGHCLGGQLMAKALGGKVEPNPVKEIGWGAVTVADCPEAKRWFGGMDGFDSFHWHGETFAVPPGAAPILSSRYCVNQAFAWGPHLGLQCHVEMTAELIDAWCESGAKEIARHPGPSVQSVDAIREGMATKLEPLHRVAERLYDRWTEGLAR